jgi:hypothetical protein
MYVRSVATRLISPRIRSCGIVMKRIWIAILPISASRYLLKIQDCYLKNFFNVLLGENAPQQIDLKRSILATNNSMNMESVETAKRIH